MLLAVRCSACDRPGPSPCPRCLADLRPPAPEPDPPGLTGLVVGVRYDGPARALVAQVKYRNRRQTLAWMADLLAARVVERRAGVRTLRGAAAVDVVTWAPTTDEHRRERGFDHGELLARAVARRLGVPCRRLLRREAGPAQTGRAAHARRDRGPRFAVRSSPPPGAIVLVVDDVVTTGATLRAASSALRRGGAAEVVPAALARTPAHRRRSGGEGTTG